MLSLKDLGYVQNGIGSCRHRNIWYYAKKKKTTFKGATQNLFSARFSSALHVYHNEPAYYTPPAASGVGSTRPYNESIKVHTVFVSLLQHYGYCKWDSKYASPDAYTHICANEKHRKQTMWSGILTLSHSQCSWLNFADENLFQKKYMFTTNCLIFGKKNPSGV